jgi:hypothetical protein
MRNGKWSTEEADENTQVASTASLCRAVVRQVIHVSVSPSY